jgi:hypothetical protein
VSEQELRGAVRNPFDVAFELAVVVLDEEAGERQNIVGALAQGWDQDLDDV